MPRDGDHSAARHTPSGPAQDAPRPERRVHRRPVGSPSTRCSSSHVSTSAAGAARSPQSSSSVATTSTSHGPSSVVASPSGGGAVASAPPDPHTSSAHGPSPNVTRTRTPPSTSSASTAAPRAAERLPQLAASPDTPDTTTSIARRRGRVEPVARGPASTSASRRARRRSRSRWRAGRRRARTAPRRRRRGAATSAPAPGPPRRDGPSAAARPSGAGTCTAAPAAKRRRRRTAAARARPPAGSGPTAIKVPPASTNSVSARRRRRARARRSPAARRPSSDSARVCSAALARRRAAHRVVVEHVEVARERVQGARRAARTTSCARSRPCRAASARSPASPTPLSRSAERAVGGGKQHADVAGVRPPRQRGAQPGDGAANAPWWRQYGWRQSVDGGAHSHQPARSSSRSRAGCRGSRRRRSQGSSQSKVSSSVPPQPAGVERLDPDARPVVVVGERGVDLGVAVMVGAGRAEPAVGAGVVGVDPRRRDRMPSRGAGSCWSTPHSSPCRSCHSCSGRKNASSAELAADAVVVAAEALARRRVLQQRRQVRQRVVAQPAPRIARRSPADQVGHGRAARPGTSRRSPCRTGARGAPRTRRAPRSNSRAHAFAE